MVVFSSLFGVAVPRIVEGVLFIAGVYLVAVALTWAYFARIHKFKVPGPRFVTPLLGGIVTMIRDPYAYWEQQRQYATNGYSWASILNQFTIFATNADLCHKIFSANGPDSLTLQLHPNGKIILGDNNIAFQHGPVHKALRASFMNLFTTKALSLYLPIQERIIMEHLASWVQKFPDGVKPEEMRTHIRDMNCETSQTVFLGRHLQNRAKFSQDYNLMTEGFLTAPLYFPGTTLYKAVQGRKRAMVELEAAVRRSKEAMSQPDAEPHCLLDFWTATILTEIADATNAGQDAPPYSADHAMADTVMDFLFASQDASTASLSMITATMAEFPDILERVRKEQARVRPNDEALTYELVQEMTYTRQCVLEQLRLHPPAPMVPMMAHGDFKIDDNFTAPKGTLIIPSLVGACRDEEFKDADKYDPDRMGPERADYAKKQFIPFGVGPHRCVGYNYAINHLAVFLALVTHHTTWTRTRTPNSDKIIYLPTLYPHDCLCTWKWREGHEYVPKTAA
jgi:cytochrome P450 family 710 subfamily A protein